MLWLCCAINSIKTYILMEYVVVYIITTVTGNKNCTPV
jgi:hypothetical protein